MRQYVPALLLLPWLFSLSACGGLNCYLHDCPPSDNNLETVVLKVGERVHVLRQTHGVIWGGYFWGLAAQDPTIVEIEMMEGNRRTDVYITGRTVGSTGLYYGNRLSMPAADESVFVPDDGLSREQHLQQLSQQRPHFTVQVQPR